MVAAALLPHLTLSTYISRREGAKDLCDLALKTCQHFNMLNTVGYCVNNRRTESN